jgi:DNA-binding transcriptional ArsR family regulator
MENDLRVVDSKVLAAMSHPLRRRLLSLLAVEGPMTVGMLAEATGQAAGSVSHHMRTLADALVVAPAPELARDRRETWWRRTSKSLSWTPRDFAGDPVGETIARAAESINVDYQQRLVAEWASASEEAREAWPEGPFNSDSWLRLTDAELAELAAEVAALFAGWRDRPLSDDGAQRSTVFVFARGVPGRP